MLEKDEKNRLNINEVLAHPFISEEKPCISSMKIYKSFAPFLTKFSRNTQEGCGAVKKFKYCEILSKISGKISYEQEKLAFLLGCVESLHNFSVKHEEIKEIAQPFLFVFLRFLAEKSKALHRFLKEKRTHMFFKEKHWEIFYFLGNCLEYRDSLQQMKESREKIARSFKRYCEKFRDKVPERNRKFLEKSSVFAKSLFFALEKELVSLMKFVVKQQLFDKFRNNLEFISLIYTLHVILFMKTAGICLINWEKFKEDLSEEFFIEEMRQRLSIFLQKLL